MVRIMSLFGNEILFSSLSMCFFFIAFMSEMNKGWCTLVHCSGTVEKNQTAITLESTCHAQVLSESTHSSPKICFN